jgi:hypothetical protein
MKSKAKSETPDEEVKPGTQDESKNETPDRSNKMTPDIEIRENIKLERLLRAQSDRAAAGERLRHLTEQSLTYQALEEAHSHHFLELRN